MPDLGLANRAISPVLPDLRGAETAALPYDQDMSPFERALRHESTRELLAALQPGGSPGRPIEVSSAAVIEPRATTIACPLCDGYYRVLEHTRPVPGLRHLEVKCRHCGTQRSLWFRIVPDEPN